MTQETLNQTIKQFALRSQFEIDANLLVSPIPDHRSFASQSLAVYANEVALALGRIGIAAKVNLLEEEKLMPAIEALITPFILFEKEGNQWHPVVFHAALNGELVMDRILDSGVETVSRQPLIPTAFEKIVDRSQEMERSKYLLITGLPAKALVSPGSVNEDNTTPFTPSQRLFRLLASERKDIGYIYIYALVVGLISLSLPIGVQAIINLISTGQFFNTVVVLISLVILGVIISGVLQILQMNLVEILQRRIFSKAAYELAYRVPRFKMEALAGYYPPELMNRFFEVVNIQKALPKLLTELTAALLQIFFGLLLLSFYHPFFIVFSLAMVIMVVGIFRFTGPKGLETSLLESKYKYRAAQWFEELARTLFTFKLAGSTNLPLEKTDQYVNKYLTYRQKHFKILVVQYSNVLIFKTLVTAGILIIGTLLVVDRQITLGQFVASELVVITVVASLEKIVLGIDVVYDLLTAVEKLGQVTDLPLESSKGFVKELPHSEKGMEIELSDFSFSYPNSEKEVIQGINLRIESGSRFCISGYSDSGKETLARLLGGLYSDYSGGFRINGVPFRDLDTTTYRNRVSKNADRSEIFDGTLLENITLNKPDISYRQVTEILHKLHLMDEINRLPHGLLTELTGTGNILSSSMLERVILARCLVIQPALLIISYPVFMMEKSERSHIQNLLMDRNLPITIGFISNDTDLQLACDQVFVLEKGHLVASGKYAEVQPFLSTL